MQRVQSGPRGKLPGPTQSAESITIPYSIGLGDHYFLHSATSAESCPGPGSVPGRQAGRLQAARQAGILAAWLADSQRGSQAGSLQADRQAGILGAWLADSQRGSESGGWVVAGGCWEWFYYKTYVFVHDC